MGPKPVLLPLKKISLKNIALQFDSLILGEKVVSKNEIRENKYLILQSLTLSDTFDAVGSRKRKKIRNTLHHEAPH